MSRCERRVDARRRISSKTAQVSIQCAVISTVLFLSSHAAAQPSVPSICGASKILAIETNLEKQKTSAWCWAAASNSVMVYKGASTEQCFVVDAVRQNQLGIYSPNTCCRADADMTPGCGDVFDYSWAALNEFYFAFDTFGDEANELGLPKLNWAKLRQFICRDEPIIYGEDYKKGGGHEYVIYGYIEDSMINRKDIIIYDHFGPPDYDEEPFDTWLRLHEDPDQEDRSYVEFLTSIHR